jgi:hypothetical protein
VAKRKDKASLSRVDQATVLEELKGLAQQLGFDVRQEKLLREVGYHVRSGSCRVRDTNIILLDRTLPVNAQIDVLVEELSGSQFEDVYLSPEARRLLEGAAA